MPILKKYLSTLFLAMLSQVPTHSAHADDQSILWNQPSGTWKGLLYSIAYRTVVGPGPVGTDYRFTLTDAVNMETFTLIPSLANGFAAADKAQFPVASKDESGNYYLELNAGVKAVKVPTPWGGLYVNLEMIGLAKELSYYAQYPSDDMLRIALLDVTSAKQFPKFDTTLHTTATLISSTPSPDHGGGWVGVQSVVFGPEASTKTTICGNPTEPMEMKLDINENGMLVGHWRAQYAVVPNCESGEIKVVSTSKLKPFKESTWTVNFK